MFLLFKSYYVFWRTVSFGMSGMQYRAIGCSVVLLLALLHLINSIYDIVDIHQSAISVALVLLMLFYFIGIYYVDSDPARLEEYDKIEGKERFIHIVVTLSSIPLIVWMFLYN